MVAKRYLLYYSYIGTYFRYHIRIDLCFILISLIVQLSFSMRILCPMKTSLLYVPYFSCRGAQRQTGRECHDPSTVQGLIDFALEKMKVKNKFATLLASRYVSDVLTQ